MTLENEIRLLEDELTRLRDEGITTPTTSMSSGIEDVDRTLNTFRSNERLLKSKVGVHLNQCVQYFFQHMCLHDNERSLKNSTGCEIQFHVV